MTDASEDTTRAFEASRAIVDGRDIPGDRASILVTTEHAVATVLLALFPDPAMAARMLNEGLVQGIEYRLSLAAASKDN